MKSHYKIAEVAVGLPIKTTFHYTIPNDLLDKIDIGIEVTVPFGKRKITGYVVNLLSESNVSNLKEIIKILDNIPLFDNKLLSLFKWIAHYYFAPLGEVIKLALPPIKKKKGKKENLGNNKDEKEIEPTPIFSDYQYQMIKIIEKSLNQEKFYPILLHGITGSGKTEIYIQSVKLCLEKGKDSIILVPEIALADQTIDSFKKRFKDKIAILHSRLSKGERYQQFRMIANSEVKIAIGVRTAIFAPFKNLGIIIIDEEHDTAYKEEKFVHYNSRDVGIMRGKLTDSIVILGSATPSLESYYNSVTKKFHYFYLPERVENKALPKVQVVDMKKEISQIGHYTILSNQLKEAIVKNFEKGKQTLIFLNRRGYSNFLFCPLCGYTFKCKNCSVTLTFHKKLLNLLCHYCGYIINIPDNCPQCLGYTLKPAGSGTEKVTEEIEKIIPYAKIERMDRDSTAKKGDLEGILKRIKKKEIDILVGTQMVTKGHNFPDITLVGVILADYSLNIPDFRSSERTFQLLTQVAGRAGRGEEEGKVIIQTFLPNHYVITSAVTQNFLDFAKEEIKLRNELSFPPFSRIININLSGPNADKTKKVALEFGTILTSQFSSLNKSYPQSIEYFGPIPASISKIRGKYRWQVVVKGKDYKILHKFISNVVKEYENIQHSGIILDIDVDPISMM